MKAKILNKTELVIVEDLCDDNPVETTTVFEKGEEIEFDVISHPLNSKFQEDKSVLNIQFPDGSVAFGVSKEWLSEDFILKNPKGSSSPEWE